jgi:arabinan endo-1,5-alpha-L-arabinosidase
MTRTTLYARQAALSLLLLLLNACGESILPASAFGSLSYSLGLSDRLAEYTLAGDTHAVLDPSIIRQGGTTFLFSTDVLGSSTPGALPIRCSDDEATWSLCGAVFPTIPGWVRKEVPGIRGLWAPDISFFNGLYHVYYSGSTLGSQRSVIGMATNVTLDRSDPAYRWVDAGEVVASVPGDDFNAIDPNIFVDTDGRIFLTYGSYWSGIKQMQLDPGTGLPLRGTKRFDLATRPGVAGDPIEGASLVRHGNFYYLFVSIDFCCKSRLADDNYKQAVGRSTSPNGPFTDINGTPMMSGGSTVLLEGDARWHAPGGGTARVDPASGEASLAFHALDTWNHGAQYVWLKHITWQNDWPSLN